MVQRRRSVSKKHFTSHFTLRSDLSSREHFRTLGCTEKNSSYLIYGQCGHLALACTSFCTGPFSCISSSAESIIRLMSNIRGLMYIPCFAGRSEALWQHCNRRGGRKERLLESTNDRPISDYFLVSIRLLSDGFRWAKSPIGQDNRGMSPSMAFRQSRVRGRLNHLQCAGGFLKGPLRSF